MSTDSIIVTIVFASCATAHFVGMGVMAMLARHRVQYLSLAWIMAIFFAVISIVAMFGDDVASGRPGILNPYMMLMLVVGMFLQSIHALGIAMPGYLQWPRMLKYASPIIVLAISYMLAMYLTGTLTKVYSLAELFQKIFSFDLILRLLALVMGAVYVFNIVFLPLRLAQKTAYPVSLIVYMVVLMLSLVFYLYTALYYTPMLLCCFLVLFTIVNFFWICYSIDSLVLKVPHPDIRLDSIEADEIEVSDVESQVEETQQRDFNEMNLQRYLCVQKWMQSNKELWIENGFSRDRLCEETGINRQLMLQCLRSQGYNNIHEYITMYRVQELKRLIVVGKITSVSDSYLVGFVAPKTARSCFERIEGENLDAFISSRVKRGVMDNA